MATNLLEAYAKRLSVSESVYNKTHNGAPMSKQMKIVTARAIANTNALLSESFGNITAGGQMSDFAKDYKRFCTNIATIAVPGLIAPELVMTVPMTSASGYRV